MVHNRNNLDDAATVSQCLRLLDQLEEEAYWLAYLRSNPGCIQDDIDQLRNALLWIQEVVMAEPVEELFDFASLDASEYIN
jgi:hypothetical protein